MMDLEVYLDPLWRPPLSLAVLAAGLKYVAAVFLLEDPVLVTKDDYVRRRQDPAMACRRRALLCGQLLFVGLAAQNLVLDLNVVAISASHLSLGSRCHLSAMVLAFSPNTVTAVVGIFIFGVKAMILKDLPLDGQRLCRSSDKLAQIFALSMGLFYLLPLVLVSLSYGSIGLFTISYAFLWDLLSLPWRLLTGDMSAIWVAVPVAAAILMSHVLSVALVAGHAMVFQWRYPELAQKICKEGTRINVLNLSFASNVQAHIIGRSAIPDAPFVDIAGGGGADGLVASEAGQSSLSGWAAEEESRDAGTGSTRPKISGAHSDTEKCILNDERIAFLTYFRAAVCVALPLLQVSVIIAAKVFLGDGLWQASQKTFGERSWSHYLEHARSSGLSGAVPLFWYYL